MTDIAREAIELAEKASPGPWVAEGQSVVHDSRHQVCCGSAYNDDCCGNFDFAGDYSQVAETGKNDAPFIAFAREALPALARSLLELRDENERLKQDTASNERVIAARGATACHLNRRIKVADESVIKLNAELATLRERCAGYDEMLRRAKAWTPPNGQIWKDIEAALTKDQDKGDGNGI